MIKPRDLFTTYRNQLLAIYSKQEAESLVFWLFEEILKIRRRDVLNNLEIPTIPKKLELAFEKLLLGVPIQYVFGKAPFYGREFKVSPAVLIPRNETEELVHLIIKENPDSRIRILDIGTGTGCIPITLKLELSKSSVFGCDISEPALKVAEENALKLGVETVLFKLDILTENIPLSDLDIIVSNPPYIRSSEKSTMHQNVLQNEPHLALFVPEEDPLVFYRRIGILSLNSLKPGGKIYFEINEGLGKETRNLLEELGFGKVRIIKDLNEKDRIVSCVKPF